MHAPAVSIQNLSKRYGDLKAVDNLQLDVAPGEILGFLGLNGAGKTTTIRILLDLLRPSSGSAFVFGHDCQKDGLAVRSRIGYLPGELGLYADLTGREVLNLLAGLSDGAPDPRLRNELQARFGLPDSDLSRRLREYSTGMKRKLGLIQAFQSDPELLILDEPTEGLDPLMQEAFYSLLAEARGRGRTVFMSSHVLSEVERVCDRVALLRRGQLVLLSGIDDLRAVATRRVRVFFFEAVPPPTELPPLIGVTAVKPMEWTLEVQGPLGPFIERLRALPLKDIEVAEAKLEDVVLKYYRGDGV